MRYNLPHPNVQLRSRVYPHMLHRGSVVAYRYWDILNRPRTGIIVMADRTMMLVAINFCDENEDGAWYMDLLPDNIELYEAEKEEKLWGFKFFLESVYFQQHESDEQNPYISFINEESPKQYDSYAADVFCKDFLSSVPYILERSEWEPLKQQLWQAIQQSGGLQFNRFRTENYCFLIGVLMIAETWNNDCTDEMKLELFKREWNQFSWMYGMVIGRVIGAGLNNFTAVVNQAGQNKRKHYLHLYLPLVENNLEKICNYKIDNRYKLEAAIRKAREKEALEEQHSDLDELYHILFPKHFVLAMADSRPAATIADLKEKLAERDQIITKLQADIDDVSRKYNAVLEQLKNAVNDVENDRISGEDLTESFLMFPTELALSYYGTMSALFALNATWQKYAPRIFEKIMNKQKELQDRQEQKQDKFLDSMEKAANKKTNEFKVYPQAGSTANVGCQMQNPEFKVIPPSKEQQQALERCSATKGDTCQSKNKEGDKNI